MTDTLPELTDPLAPDDEAPYGYTIDRVTGARRPKLKAGRPGKEAATETSPGPASRADSPGLDQLKEAAQAAHPERDRAPQAGGKRGTRRRGTTLGKTAPVPAFKPGVICTGVNKLYRKAGKIVRAMDHDIGTAIIESAKNTADPGEPDDSVGAAWEELAKTNPRIRKALLKVISGGAWGELIMAHAPIAMAIMMKPAIMKFIPFGKILASFAEPDEDTKPGEGGLPGGMTNADMGQVADLAMRQMQKMGLEVSPEMAQKMGEMANAMGNGNGHHPPGVTTVRAQPRKPGSRAQRAGK